MAWTRVAVIALLSLGVGVLAACAQETDNVDALKQQAWQLRRAGKIEQATKIGERVLALTEHQYSPDDPRVATVLDFLADVGPTDFRQSQALYFRALHIREKALGPDHPDVAKSLAFIAYLYAGYHFLDSAVWYRDRSVAIYTKMLDDVERQMRSLVDAGQYEEALAIARRAEADQKDGFIQADMGKSCSPTSASCGMLWFRAMALPVTSICPALNARGKLDRDQGRFDDAEQQYKRCLAIIEKIALPLDPPLNVQQINAVEGLAALYESQGRASDAAPLRQRIQHIAENQSRSVNEVAKIRHDQGHIDEAEALYKRGVALAEAVSNPGDPLKRELVTALNGLAAIDDAQGRADEATALRQRAKAIEKANAH